jgi:hypothetical protein
MFWSISSKAAKKNLNSRLSVEMLGDRLAPSDLPLPPAEPSNGQSDATINYTSAQNNITITSFTVVAIANNYFEISGHVSADDMTDMTIFLGGGGPNVTGVIVNVDADGNFSILIQLTPADQGVITAIAVDQNGEVSLPAVDHVIVN